MNSFSNFVSADSGQKKNFGRKLFPTFPHLGSLYLVKLEKDDKIIQLAKTVAVLRSWKVMIINYGNFRDRFFMLANLVVVVSVKIWFRDQ